MNQELTNTQKSHLNDLDVGTCRQVIMLMGVQYRETQN